MTDAGPSGNETEILEQIRNGDAEAFVEYAESKRRALEAFVKRKLSDALKRKVEPEDVVQEAIISAAGSFEQMDLSERDPFSWLCHLAERRIIDAHRRFFGAQKRAADREVGLHTPIGDGERGGFIDLLVASLTSPSQAFSREQREFRMLAAIDELPDDARTALQLRYVEALPSKEIAERLGKSDAAVRVLLTRSLGKLQKLLRTDTLFKSFVRDKQQEGPPPEPLE
jgi:RNA polymerase sigma-70 factor (subfamily 1)